jgi:uncharacterized tellurite resistance protein B-like protein
MRSEHIALTESERVAFLGAMLSMAAADGRIEASEVDHIFDLISVQQLSREAHTTLQEYLVDPPELHDCLARLRSTGDAVRLGLMLGLLQVAWADEVMDPAETSLLDSARETLRVSLEQRRVMERFIDGARELMQRGVDDQRACETLTRIVSDMTDVGIPLAAVYYAGTILRLRAAGIAAGLDTVGLGVGTVPGLDIAVLFSVELCMAVRQAFGEAIEQRREQRAVDNLQAAINELIDRVVELEETADDNEQERAALQSLTKRLRALQQAFHGRTQPIKVPPEVSGQG